jgi:2-polyprenyl-6-methoxyphenol hydroxylase-like FAD-dependent oxidoreductase
VPWQSEGFDAAALTQRYHRASVMVGVLPIGRTSPGGPELAALFWSLKPDEYETLKRDGLDAWKQKVLGHWPEVRPHLESIGDFSEMTLARYAHHTMVDPTGPALAFVGDSAHSASPQLGQGANMALLDTRALYLGLRDHPDDVQRAVTHYAALRREHVRLYQALSLGFTPFYQADGRVRPWIRDHILGKAARLPFAPRLLAATVSGLLLDPRKTIAG